MPAPTQHRYAVKQFLLFFTKWMTFRLMKRARNSRMRQKQQGLMRTRSFQ